MRRQGSGLRRIRIEHLLPGSRIRSLNVQAEGLGGLSLGLRCKVGL